MWLSAGAEWPVGSVIHSLHIVTVSNPPPLSSRVPLLAHFACAQYNCSAPILGDPSSPTPEPPNVTTFGATSHTSQRLSSHSVVAGQHGLVSVSVLGEGQEVTNLGQDKQPYLSRTVFFPFLPPGKSHGVCLTMNMAQLRIYTNIP